MSIASRDAEHWMHEARLVVLPAEAAGRSRPRAPVQRVLLPSTFELPETQAPPTERSLEHYATVPVRPRDLALLQDSDAGAVIQLAGGLELELCTASELQEADTAGYWDEFHLGRPQDYRLDLSWRWYQKPGLAWIGCIGAPRTLDRSTERSFLDPDLVFLALGTHWRF